MTRSELIQVLVVRVKPGDQQNLREILKLKTLEELEQLHLEVVLEDSEERLIEIQAERGFNRAFHEMEMEKFRAPQREAQQERDFETFKQAASRLNYSALVEANFRVLSLTLGPGFTFYDIQNAITSNAVHLAAPKQQELVKWAREADQQRQQAAELHQDFLKNRATPTELREAARTEAEQRRAAAQQQHIASQVQAREAAEAGRFPVLPETTSDGVKLDATFFKNLERGKYRQFCSKYGFAAITARLNQVR